MSACMFVKGGAGESIVGGGWRNSPSLFAELRSSALGAEYAFALSSAIMLVLCFALLCYDLNARSAQ